MILIVLASFLTPSRNNEPFDKILLASKYPYMQRVSQIQTNKYFNYYFVSLPMGPSFFEAARAVISTVKICLMWNREIVLKFITY